MAYLEKVECFPTCIYTFQYKFQPKEREALIHFIDTGSYGRNQQGKKTKTLGSQPNDQLHKKQLFKNLVNHILVVSSELMDDQGYEYEKLEITSMWGNILQPSSVRAAHAPHIHSNNFLSGTFYLKASAQTAPIVFFDPRPQSSILKPKKKQQNRLNTNQKAFDSVAGCGLIFPSWLQHWVPQTNAERISVAWNIMVRGAYGEPNSLQNAYL